MIGNEAFVALRLTHGQLWTSVLATLRMAIIKGDFKPNSHLLETQLAEMLGVSRGPVREALVRLEHEGLVVNIPYRGKFVAEITPSMVREIYSLRRLLEGFAAELATARMTPEQADHMRALSVEMMEALAEGNYEDFADLDIEFHRVYVAAAGHKRLLQTWETLMGISHSFIVVNASGFSTDNDVIARGHEAIIEAIDRRDGEALRLAAQNSMDEGERRVLQLVKRQPFDDENQ
jgi:DNA-binding GntR family transcriptional regulator